MAVSSAFFNLPIGTLQALQTQYAQCAFEIATVGKNYTVGNRSYSLADLPEVQQVLANLNAAISKYNGNRRKTVLGNLRYRFPASATNQ